LVLPAHIRRQAGIKPGDQMDVRVSSVIIRPIPKLPKADDEYTPEQRRVIDAQIAEGLEDVEHGRLHGPFETHEKMVKFLHGRAKKTGGKGSHRKTR
jgi:AbrB family looped-hinge helix DNA binding protein